MKGGLNAEATNAQSKTKVRLILPAAQGRASCEPHRQQLEWEISFGLVSWSADRILITRSVPVQLCGIDEEINTPWGSGKGSKGSVIKMHCYFCPCPRARLFLPL